MPDNPQVQLPPLDVTEDDWNAEPEWFGDITEPNYAKASLACRERQLRETLFQLLNANENLLTAQEQIATLAAELGKGRDTNRKLNRDVGKWQRRATRTQEGRNTQIYKNAYLMSRADVRKLQAENQRLRGEVEG